MTDTTPQAPETKADTGATLKRALIMLAFAIFTAIAENVLLLIALVQALWMLFTGAPNAWVRDFGKSLSVWIADVAKFQSVASEERPFPWKPWPKPNEAD
jgi:hypothetical protein